MLVVIGWLVSRLLMGLIGTERTSRHIKWAELSVHELNILFLMPMLSRCSDSTFSVRCYLDLLQLVGKSCQIFS